MNLPRHDSRPAASEAASRSGMRVAFFGGSFDPPHLGHLAVARAARAAFALDKVLFAPVGMQPLKKDGSAASFEDRMAMTRLAIRDEPGFEASLIDFPKLSDTSKPAAGRNAQPNYAIETLKALRSSLPPGATLFCLMGADSFFTLHHWFRAAEIPFAAPLIVASRPGQPLEKVKDALPAGLTLEPAPDAEKNEAGVDVRAFVVTNAAGDRASLYVLPGLHVEISASEIRTKLQTARSGAAALDCVPAAVRDYIVQHKLYGSQTSGLTC
ncbi:MAG: nicotinate (nicotinamide) nucleotide adenylyltransferase [Terracidiphilus sp.]